MYKVLGIAHVGLRPSLRPPKLMLFFFSFNLHVYYNKELVEALVGKKNLTYVASR